MVNQNDKIYGCKNFIWKEMFASTTAARLGINNYPPASEEKRILANLEYAMQYVQKARDYFDTPIRINSGYRCPALNKAVSGSDTSFHAHGMAVDLSFPAGSRFELSALFSHFFVGLYTELIAEDISEYGGWIHFALAKGREEEKQLKYKLVGKPVVRASYEEIMKKCFNK